MRHPQATSESALKPRITPTSVNTDHTAHHHNLIPIQTVQSPSRCPFVSTNKTTTARNSPSIPFHPLMTI
jgi:hypothetical protein